MKKLLFLLLIISTSLGVNAQIGQKITLSASPTSVSFEAFGGEKKITVATNAPSWSVSGVPVWCTAQKSENTVTLRCNANPNTYDRNGSFAVKAGDKTVTIQIRQEAKAVLSLSSTTAQFDAAGGSQTIYVNGVSSYALSSTYSWCKQNKYSNYFTLTCDPNTSTSARSDEFNVNANGQSIKVTIKQNGKEESAASDDERLEITDVKFADADINGKILSNFGSILYNNTSYLIPKITYNNLAQDSKTITLDVKVIRPDGTLMRSVPNSNVYTYSTTISLTGENKESIEKILEGFGKKSKNEYSETGTYTWEIWCSGKKLYKKNFVINAKPSLRVSTMEVVFEADGGTKTVNVYDVSSFTTSSTFSWCKLSTYPSYFTLTCEANPNTTERSGEFNVNANGQSIKVTIKQNGKTSYSTTTNFTLEDRDWTPLITKAMTNVTEKDGDDKYKGQISNGYRHGLGVYYWQSSEAFYCGAFSNGYRGGGVGIYFIGKENSEIKNCPNCVFYVGNFSARKKSGTGSCYDKTGKLIYNGKFSNNKPAETYPKQYNDVYKFEFLDFEDGDFYLGETKNGDPHGYGMFLYKDGNISYARFDEGRHVGGTCILLDYDGSITIF